MSFKVIVETSARHIHLTKEHVELLFGAGHELTPKKELSQPGQFACEERVKIDGPRGSFPSVSVLGPVRSATQLEISLTDARTLGITAPIRESGDIKGSAGCKITGPCGSIDITEGVIIAKRHIHITPEDAKIAGVSDKEIVSIKIESDGRTTIYGDTVVRISGSFATRVHLDVDEANAAGICGEAMCTIIK